MLFPGRTVCFLLIISLILLDSTPKSVFSAAPTRPNILLIAIDDLNDWVGCLGGHPQASTPNIDALAARGTLFANAHCQAPVCQPSRASLMTSLLPSSTGIYFLNPGIDDSPVASEQITLPARFAREGYQILGAGKAVPCHERTSVFPSWRIRWRFRLFWSTTSRKNHLQARPSALGLGGLSRPDKTDARYANSGLGRPLPFPVLRYPLFSGSWILPPPCSDACASRVDGQASTRSNQATYCLLGRCK